jgi:hypothetical protein
MISDLQSIVLSYLPYNEYFDKDVKRIFPHNYVYWRSCQVANGKVNGVLHSLDDLPRIMDNRQTWYHDGKFHRDEDDGPAIIQGALQGWYQRGLLHRSNGPAVINGNHRKWYQHGICLEVSHICRVPSTKHHVRYLSFA